MVVWRPNTGTWHVLKSSTNFVSSFSRQWGTQGDIPLADTDLDGDGHDDMIVWRPNTGTWHVLKSSTNFVSSFSRQWGTQGDIPLADTDLDGDGHDDMIVWRPDTGTWHVLKSSTNFVSSFSRQWGTQGDIPLADTDLDGDGHDDMIVWRPDTGTWHVLKSSTNFVSSFSRQWGTQGDIPFADTDLDGDGRDDIVVWRPGTGTWHVLKSSTSFVSSFSRQWGTQGDIPAADTDLDGDGRDDIVVWRPGTGTWHVLTSSTSFVSSFSRQWGTQGDIPLAPGSRQVVEQQSRLAPRREPTSGPADRPAGGARHRFGAGVFEPLPRFVRGGGAVLLGHDGCIVVHRAHPQERGFLGLPHWTDRSSQSTVLRAPHRLGDARPSSRRQCGRRPSRGDTQRGTLGFGSGGKGRAADDARPDSGTHPEYFADYSTGMQVTRFDAIAIEEIGRLNAQAATTSRRRNHPEGRGRRAVALGDCGIGCIPPSYPRPSRPPTASSAGEHLPGHGPAVWRRTIAAILNRHLMTRTVRAARTRDAESLLLVRISERPRRTSASACSGRRAGALVKTAASPRNQRSAAARSKRRLLSSWTDRSSAPAVAMCPVSTDLGALARVVSDCPPAGTRRILALQRPGLGRAPRDLPGRCRVGGEHREQPDGVQTARDRARVHPNTARPTATPRSSGSRSVCRNCTPSRSLHPERAIAPSTRTT